MKKALLKKIFPVTLLLTVALTFCFSGYGSKVQAKTINNKKVFITNCDSLISTDKYVDVRTIPTNFDATKATDEELEYYNLPKRPKTEKELARWKKRVSCKWIEPELVETNIKHSNNTKFLTNDTKITSTTSSEVKMNTTISGIANDPHWAGYVHMEPSSYVFGEWIVPKVSAPSANWPAYCSQWVGLGGYCSKTLVQTGTASDIDRSGYSSYYPWFELLGTNYETSNEVKIKNLTCKPNDQIDSEVSTSISGNTMTVKFCICNETTNLQTSFAITVTQFNNVPNSAEWISEAPAITFNGQPCTYSYPLTTTTFNGSHNTASFTDCAYRSSANSSTMGINESTSLAKYTLTNGSKILAQPGNIGAGSVPFWIIFALDYSSGFDVNWYNYK